MKFVTTPLRIFLTLLFVVILMFVTVPLLRSIFKNILGNSSILGPVMVIMMIVLLVIYYYLLSKLFGKFLK